ncbi:YopX family protein [Streptococcus suis]|uniref:Phage protein n=1 Tax=Streptococcus suis TaxID=1307 RepID=A0A0Z8KV12_STRSU|nr:YopX family protein [Streptococcus suis]NQG42611.1 hypothetical protein [Streptococcus suis]NQG72682.1 hypothetical protein [Streptococcus suis]NQQ50807.1 hypothetical protein [Streptococcus suis]CYV39234.1 phage protein [Streptococcus suis]CYV79066.1 phage protein [Streptococcus suis]
MIPRCRAWHKAMQRMSEVLAISYERQKVKIKHQRGTTHMTVPLDDVILMQSTGKMDSTGQVEVYAGDILYYPDQDEDNFGIIKFDEDTLAFVLDNGYERFVYGDYGMGKVIGNIYQNKDLVDYILGGKN